MTHLYIYAFLAGLVLLFPKDALMAAQWLDLQVKLHYMNALTFWLSWTTYCKLKRDMAALGWPAPPFKYTPLWNRK